MAIERAHSSRVHLRINTGSSGSPNMVSISLGRMMANADAEKIMNVVEPLAGLISRQILEVRRTEVTTIEW